ncbi:Ig-like domain-containing protein [Methylovirgula sp. 4M-Z18]|uniref:Ig-like domain-containing protein n=1 Tax=Methylovirgula sp. 4M-Z18 TaxID=2293567 RepID=UPI000E2E76CF|nr:Ig-like domain-containing protein [Methylovirgula sp. 4M-Z18]RFB81076.1 Ig-like domain repeat protein [Methylovirgula sp. 4M-Z18]
MSVNTAYTDPLGLPNGDGSIGAAGGVLQEPGLLNNYASRPAWQVAGVDYAVGVTPNTVLQTPTVNDLPAGVTLGQGVIYVDGNNVTLNGYDLTNYTVMVNSDATGTVTISNCAATTGVNIRSTVDATANLVVQNCTFDGGGMASDPNFQLIKVWTPLTVEYSVIKNAPAAIYAGGGAPLTVLYNEMEGFAWSPGAHANAIYVTGGNNPSATTLIAYNTIYSGATQNAQGFPIGLGAAIAFFDDGGNFYHSTVANNTVISALPGGSSYLIGFYVGSGHSATGGVVENNFVASVNGFNNANSGAYGAFYTGSSGVVQATYTHNVDMSDGYLIAGDNTETPLGAGSPPIVGGSPLSPPVIGGFSPDTGIVGDHITNANQLTLTGTAAANSTLAVFDGTTQVGTTTADANGQWTFTTQTLSDGNHHLTATDTTASGTSAPSADFAVTIDTHVPGAPTMMAQSQDGYAVGSTTTLKDIVLQGTAEVNSTVNVFDSGKPLGSAVVDGTGKWSFDTGQLANGLHNFTAAATDIAGTTSAPSATLSETIGAPSHDPHKLIIKGMATADSHIQMYDGQTYIGTVTASADGHWTFVTPSVLSDDMHTFRADDIGAGAPSSANVIVGSTGGSVLAGVSGNDYFFGRGHPDTFVFAQNFGHESIKDFVPAGATHDVIQFSASEFDSFASVLSHAAQVGQDVTIATANDVLTLKNTQLGALNSHDFHFA